MCVLLHLLICTALRVHIIVAEALYYYYYYLTQSFTLTDTETTRPQKGLILTITETYKISHKDFTLTDTDKIQDLTQGLTLIDRESFKTSHKSPPWPTQKPTRLQKGFILTDTESYKISPKVIGKGTRYSSRRVVPRLASRERYLVMNSFPGRQPTKLFECCFRVLWKSSQSADFGSHAHHPLVMSPVRRCSDPRVLDYIVRYPRPNTSKAVHSPLKRAVQIFIQLL